ncbi:MAG: hypothetical protein OHK93_004400 [Ramalina farinacea]|uniref:C2H2-type domain-containing protein n=1 Tax=Ramalina farinacea TaxID=258253 RepID=A0AA43TYG0_9LECA|nr:hypothetical protein [Ramalina farinacea]
MNLSNIVHSDREKYRERNIPRSVQRHSDPYPHRLYDPRQEDMATALTVNSHHRISSPSYSSPPHPPPSPPLSDYQSSRTLPSIQSLINMDDSKDDMDMHGTYDSRHDHDGVSARATMPNGRRPQSYGHPAKVATSGAQHLYYQQQRPVPTTFAPSMSTNVNPITPPSGDTSPIESNNSQWHHQHQHQHQHQHHHYIAPSHSASFSGQNSDRYVCPVCSKAFSRPSSLRIHSHSHTGEKPFLCPHKGCGKAFSVRSNMKRHERGCHGGGESGD